MGELADSGRSIEVAEVEPGLHSLRTQPRTGIGQTCYLAAEWEGFASATRAAAAGGVTTIVDMPLNSLPPTVSVAALDAKREVAGPKAFVDVGFWGGAIPGNTADLRPLHEAGLDGFEVLPRGLRGRGIPSAGAG